MTIHFRRASRSGGGAFIAKLYRGQHLLSCPAAFCMELAGFFNLRDYSQASFKAGVAIFIAISHNVHLFSVKPQRQQNVSAQPFMLRKTKNQTINNIQILKK